MSAQRLVLGGVLFLLCSAPIWFPIGSIGAIRFEAGVRLHASSHAELDVGQLADVVEHAYERDELPDWGLVFELSRRVMSAEGNVLGQGAVGAAPTGLVAVEV